MYIHQIVLKELHVNLNYNNEVDTYKLLLSMVDKLALYTIINKLPLEYFGFLFVSFTDTKTCYWQIIIIIITRLLHFAKD